MPKKLTHNRGYMIFFLSFHKRNHISVYLFPVYQKRGNTLFQMIGVLYLNVVNRSAEPSGDGEITEVPGNTGVNAQPCEARLDTQNILGNIHEGPGSGSCEPAVLCFPVRGASLPAIIWE